MSQISKFYFFESYYDNYKDLDQDEKAEYIKAILEFAFDGIEPEFTTKACKIAWNGTRHNLDISVKRSQSGAKGGAPKGNTNARKPAKNDEEEEENELRNKKENKNRQNSSKKQPKNKQNSSKKQPNISLSSLNYLNSRTGSKFEPTEQTENLLTAIFDAGYTFENVKTVIDRKCDEWSNVPHMRPQLTPLVLFKFDNFERYLQSAPTEQETQRSENEVREAQARANLEKLRRKYEEADSQYQQETNRDRKFDLRARREELQAMIESEERKLSNGQ